MIDLQRALAQRALLRRGRHEQADIAFETFTFFMAELHHDHDQNNAGASFSHYAKSDCACLKVLR